jgi:hypothetical protein
MRAFMQCSISSVTSLEDKGKLIKFWNAINLQLLTLISHSYKEPMDHAESLVNLEYLYS